MIDAMRRRVPGWLALVLFLAATLGIGYLGSRATAPAIGGWYAGLVKPAITPPNAVFAPVWTTLYVLMAVAAWLVWRAPDGPGRRAALRVFWIQLALNLAWSWIFFGARDIGWAFFEILLLLVALALTLWRFHAVAPRAALLLVPYAAWTGFAAVLTWQFWQLNPAR